MNTPNRRYEQETRAHFGWQEHVAARADLTPVYKIVAWALALFRNIKTGRCDPSCGGLAKRAGVSERTVKRAITEFERLGLLAVDRSSGGASSNRNHYRLLLPQGVSDVTPQGVSGRARRGVQTGQRGVSELCHPNTKRNMLGGL